MVRRGVVAIIAILIVSFGMHAFAQAVAPDGRIISVYDHGQEYRFLTKETTIGDALEEAGIPIDPNDSVEPSRDEPLVASEYRVNVYRTRPVIVTDGTTRVKILSARQTATQIAKDAGITLYDEDVATLDLLTNIGSDGVGQSLSIDRATPLTLDLYGKKSTIRTQAATVKDLLAEKRITLTAVDRVSPTENTPVTSSMELRIWREGVQTVNVDETLAPSVRIVYDVNRPLGYRAVQSKGAPGLKTITYQIEIRDGKEVYRKKIAEFTSRQPGEQIEVIGLYNNGQGLTLSKGAQYFVDGRGISHRETYYDLPMNVVMSACGQGGYYTVRPDGAKVDRDGYIIIAANYGNYPRCSVVETSLGPGKVYDTGGFAARHPHGFDLATDWTNRDGR